jgi:hypothetical protein
LKTESVIDCRPDTDIRLSGGLIFYGWKTGRLGL